MEAMFYLILPYSKVQSHPQFCSAILKIMDARESRIDHFVVCVWCVAVALQLQQFELEVFGNVGISTPIINTGRGVTFGFGGYPSLPLEAAIPTFAPPPGSSSPIPAPIAFGPGGGISYSSNTNFVFGAVRQEQPVARAAMDHSMDSS